MSEDTEKEKIKKIAKLRAILETRVETMQTELDGLKTLLTLIDETLLKDSFKRAEISTPVQTPPKQQTQPSAQPSPPQVTPQKKGVPLKTVTGDVLAYFSVEKDSVQITLAEDKNFDINIPPFRSFFVERVLAKMQEKDREDVSKGKMAPENVLSYNIKQDGNTIMEITVKDLRRERSRELKSSIRWTLEKMYEKMKQNS
jgi:hypothetical protein